VICKEGKNKRKSRTNLEKIKEQIEAVHAKWLPVLDEEALREYARNHNSELGGQLRNLHEELWFWQAQERK
jgi:hypothetical protein